MKAELTCPTCGSHDIIKNGLTRRAKQNHKCKDCGRQFVEAPQWRVIPPDTKAMIDRLLLERIPLAGIVRVLQLSAPWVQRYVNRVFKQVSRTLNVSPKTQGPLTVQMDELWSFVDHKGNKQWVWLAMDATTREIIGCAIGDRSQFSAAALWASLPGVYRQCGIIYTDGWEAYGIVLPSKRHRVVSKDSGKTSYIERFNNTLRQRVGRLVRKTLSFSETQANHEGAIWNFIHHYNASLRCDAATAYA